MNLMVVLALAVTPAAAQQVNERHCVSASDCAIQEDIRDTQARQAAWDANVKRNEAFEQQHRALAAQARATSIAGRAARSQDIMHRRHAAAEAAGN